VQWAGVGMEEMEVAPEMDSIVDRVFESIDGACCFRFTQGGPTSLVGRCWGLGEDKTVMIRVDGRWMDPGELQT